ncbi:Helix-turn-helix [Singulisphaera sp. GP187]|nr:Helix-turn-helix [Singulisphaera sp. GP187]
MTLADQLRAAIANCNRSEYEIATESGVSQGSVTRFMRGERDWTLGTADHVAEVLGLDLAGAKYAPASRPGAKRLPRRVTSSSSPATTADVVPELN